MYIYLQKCTVFAKGVHLFAKGVHLFAKSVHFLSKVYIFCQRCTFTILVLSGIYYNPIVFARMYTFANLQGRGGIFLLKKTKRKIKI